MVALNEQFRHKGTQPRLQGAGYGLQRGGEFVEVFSDHGPMTTDQKLGSSVDLFVDHCSLIFERSAGANEIIYCGYPDNKRVSTDIGMGLNDPETELYYARDRSYNPIPGTVLRQEPKSRQATGVATRVLQRDPIGYAGGINLYEYVGGRASVATDSDGLQLVSPGYLPPIPVINPAAAEAAEALLAALAAELEWSWIPDVALAAAATAAILLAWEVTCRALYAAYKAACDAVPNYPCDKGMYCDQYPAAISIRVACATGRAAYLNAGCDVIIPTTKNHPAAMLQAWQAAANCEEASNSCVQRPVCPVTG